MRWESGFSASYRAYIVDPTTWEDTDEIEITGGTISRDSGDDLLESASLDVREKLGETWVRVYLIAEQDGGTVRVPLFTGLTSSPSRDLDGLRESFSVDCYSVLKSASDKMTPLGYYAPAGARGAYLAAQLLKGAGITATYDEGSAALANTIVAESGETALTMAQRIVDAIGWQIRINGRGAVTIEPKDTEIRATFSADRDAIEPQVTDTDDWYSCPNVLRVTSGSQTIVVRDDDPASPLSTVARGREIWQQESVSLSDASALPTYALQLLAELQSHTRILKYKRRFDPDVRPGDRIRISYPASGIDGTFKVSSQSITLGFGARTEEEAYES